MTMLSSRETETLLLLASYRYLSRNQIEEFLFDGSDLGQSSRNTTSWRILHSLTARGLVQQTAKIIGGPGGGAARLGYFLTADGHRLALSLNSSLPAKRPTSGGTFLMQHALATADVSLAFRRAARSHPGHELLEWESDWQAVLRLGSSLVVPDGHLVYASRDYELDALVEVDLGTEGTRFFGRKIQRYLDLFRSSSWRHHLPIWPVIITVTPSEVRTAALQRCTETVLARQSDHDKLRAETEFAFAALPRLVAEGPLAKIWRVAGRSDEHFLLGATVSGMNERLTEMEPPG